MGAIDNRYPYPVWIRRGAPDEARILPLDFERSSLSFKRLRLVMVVSCINSIELLTSWGVEERQIVRSLFKVMNLARISCDFERLPHWLKLSELPLPVLIAFKKELLMSIERHLIVFIDPDPES